MSRKHRKAAERARRQAALRRQRLRRLAIPAGLAVLVVAAFLVYRALTTHSQPDPWASVMRLNTVHGTDGIAWSPDGTRVATGGTGQDNAIRIWDARTGALLHSMPEPRQMATSALAWSPNGAYITVAEQVVTSGKVSAKQRLLQLWQTSTWTQLPGTASALSASPALALAFSPDSKYLAAQNATDLRVLTVPALTLANAARNHVLASGFPAMVAWSPNGRQIAVSDESTGVAVLDARTLRTAQILYPGGTYPGNVLGGAAWSPNSALVAVGRLTGRVNLYAAATGKLVRTLAAAQPSVTTMAWSPDGVHLAVGGNNQLVIYDTRSGKAIQRHTAPADAPGVQTVANPIVSLAWSPDGRRLAISGSSAYARIWTPIASGKP